MINFKKILGYFLTGMAYGSICYLVIIALLTQSYSVSRTSIISVFIISGLIGELSFLFESELPFLLAFMIHLAGTFSLYVAMMLINHWPIIWWTILLFIIVYIINWIIVRLMEERQINRINQQIEQKKK